MESRPTAIIMKQSITAIMMPIAESMISLMSCGSDFHGKMKPKIQMGEYGYEKDDGEDILQAFLKRLAK